MPTFTYVPTWGAARKHKPRILKAQFNDGYAQRAADGINNDPQVWDLTFDVNPTDAAAIMAFLSARGGHEPFDWTTPNGTTLRFVCEEFSESIGDFGTYTVTAAFEQDFTP